MSTHLADSPIELVPFLNSSDHRPSSAAMSRRRSSSLHISLPLMTQQPTQVRTRAFPRTGTVISSFFSLLNYAVGVGLLILPYTYVLSGLFAGVVISLLTSFFNLLGLIVVAFTSISSSSASGGRGGVKIETIRTYQGIISTHLGSLWSFIGELSVLIATVGTNVACLEAASHFVTSAAQTILQKSDQVERQSNLILAGVGCILIFPFLLLREVKKLAWTSAVANLAAFYVVALLVVNGILALSSREIGAGVSGLRFIQTQTYGPKGLYFPWLLLSFSVKSQAYSVVSVVPPIAYEIRNVTLKKLVVTLVAFHAVLTLVYLSSGILGFAAFGTSVSDNVLSSFSRTDVAAVIGRAAVGINLILTIPVVAYPSRLAIVSLLKRCCCCRKGGRGGVNCQNQSGVKDRAEMELPLVLHLLLATSYFVVLLLLAVFVKLLTLTFSVRCLPQISIGFAFSGSLGASLMSFLCPGILALKTASRRKTPSIKICCYASGVALVLWGVFVMVTGLIGSTLHLFDAYGVLTTEPS